MQKIYSIGLQRGKLGSMASMVELSLLGRMKRGRVRQDAWRIEEEAMRDTT
jgi:hypothetical protein